MFKIPMLESPKMDFFSSIKILKMNEMKKANENQKTNTARSRRRVRVLRDAEKCRGEIKPSI